MDQTLITVLRYSITYYQKDLFISAHYANKHKATALHKAYWLPCYFLNFFVNRLYSFLPSSLLNARLHFHVIHPHLIIQHKVSFSSRFISFFFF